MSGSFSHIITRNFILCRFSVTRQWLPATLLAMYSVLLSPNVGLVYTTSSLLHMGCCFHSLECTLWDAGTYCLSTFTRWRCYILPLLLPFLLPLPPVRSFPHFSPPHLLFLLSLLPSLSPNLPLSSQFSPNMGDSSTPCYRFSICTLFNAQMLYLSVVVILECRNFCPAVHCDGCLLVVDVAGWLGSRVAKVLDLQLAGCEFNSRPGAVE